MTRSRANAGALQRLPRVAHPGRDGIGPALPRRRRRAAPATKITPALVPASQVRAEQTMLAIMGGVDRRGAWTMPAPPARW